MGRDPNLKILDWVEWFLNEVSAGGLCIVYVYCFQC